MLIFYTHFTILLFNREFLPKNHVTFNRVVISTNYNCICTLVLNTLKMATWVAETCRWLLYNKITFINPSAFVGFFNKFYTSVFQVVSLASFSPTKNLYACLFSPHRCHMSHPPHPNWYDDLNGSCWEIYTMKPLIRTCSLAPSYIIPLKHKYFPRYSVLELLPVFFT
jgi:hypothetical protein